MTIYFEIEGLVTDESLVTVPCWHSLCQYTDEQTARTIFEAIISEKINPGNQYDDFRFVVPTPTKPKLTRQERQERRAARAERQARREAKDAARARREADQGRSGTATKRRRPKT